jgi:radical SAM-linked protein
VDIVREVTNGLAATGFDEVSLKLASHSNYRNLESLVSGLSETLREEEVTARFSRVHPDNRWIDHLKKLNGSERPALSFEIEAGSERLRDLLNCDFTIEGFYQAVANAFASGWRAVRLHFNVGLPTETESDIGEIVGVVKNVDEIRREYRSKASMTIAVAPFIPRAHTIWQWEKQISREEFNSLCDLLKRKLKGIDIQLKFRASDQSYLEGVFARGDRRLADVIAKANQLGVRFDSWKEHFQIDLWVRAFEQCKIRTDDYLASRELAEPLPWDHLDLGIPKESLIKERELALSAGKKRQVVSGSFKLGDVLALKPEVAEQIIVSAAEPQVSSGYGRKPKRVKGEGVAMVVPRSRVRLQWIKEESVRFVGHLATMKVFERAIRRAKIPVSYSQGTHQRQKLAFGPPLTLGYCSNAEYLDIQLECPFHQEIITRLNNCLPPGFRVTQGKPVFGKSSSISSMINLACYSVPLPAGWECLKPRIDEVLASDSVTISRIKEGQTREFDIRRAIIGLELRPLNGVNILYMELGMGNLGFVRPEEILLQCFAMPQELVLPLLVSRTNLLITNDSGRYTPLEVD